MIVGAAIGHGAPISTPAIGCHPSSLFPLGMASETARAFLESIKFRECSDYGLHQFQALSHGGIGVNAAIRALATNRTLCERSRVRCQRIDIAASSFGVEIGKASR